MKGQLAALLGAMLLGACVATTPRIEEGRLREVRIGATAYADIVKRFGTPSLLSRNPDGTSFATYVHADPQAQGTAVVPLVAGVHRDSVTFHFDTRGLLTDLKTTSRSGEARVAARDHAEVGEAAAPGAPGMREASRSDGSASTTQKRSGGWLWRVPDWLQAAPRENR